MPTRESQKYKAGLVSEADKIFSEKKNKIIKEKDKLASYFSGPKTKNI